MRIVTWSLVMLLLALGSAAQGKTWEDGAHHVSFEVDEAAGWMLQKTAAEKKMLFFAVLPGNPPPKAVVFFGQPVAPGFESLTQRDIDGAEEHFKVGWIEKRASIAKLDERRFEIQGVPAWEARFQVRMSGEENRQVLRVFKANKHVYTMLGIAEGVGLKDDKVMLPLMDSFKFTQTPRFVPFGQDPKGGGGGLVDETSEAYQMGKLVGQILIGLLVLAFIISFIRRSSKKDAEGK